MTDSVHKVGRCQRLTEPVAALLVVLQREVALSLARLPGAVLVQERELPRIRIVGVSCEHPDASSRSAPNEPER